MAQIIRLVRDPPPGDPFIGGPAGRHSSVPRGVHIALGLTEIDLHHRPFRHFDPHDGDAIGNTRTDIVQIGLHNTHSHHGQPQVRQTHPVLTIAFADHRARGVTEAETILEREVHYVVRRYHRIVVVERVGGTGPQTHGIPVGFDLHAGLVKPYQRKARLSRFIHNERSASPVGITSAGAERSLALQQYVICPMSTANGRGCTCWETHPFTGFDDCFEKLRITGTQQAREQVKSAQMVPQHPCSGSTMRRARLQFQRHRFHGGIQTADLFSRGKRHDGVGLYGFNQFRRQ